MVALKSIFLALLPIVGLCVEATQVMHRPVDFKDTPNSFKIEKSPQTKVVQKRGTGKVQVAYFTNWLVFVLGSTPCGVTNVYSGVFMEPISVSFCFRQLKAVWLIPYRTD